MFSLNLVKGIDDRNGGYDNTQGRVLKSIDSDGTISKKKERYTMVKPIMKDIFFLGQKSEESTRTDLQVGKDLAGRTSGTGKMDFFLSLLALMDKKAQSRRRLCLLSK